MASKKFYLVLGVLVFTLVYISFMIHKLMLICPSNPDYMEIPLERAENIVHCAKVRDRKLAVVVPFLITDGPKLENWMKNMDVMRPCSEMCGPPTSDLVFYLNRNMNDHPEFAKNMTRVFSQLKYTRKCFRTLRFLSANLTDWEDFRQGLNHRGPRNMFWRAFKLLGGSYDYYFQHEPDIEAIRPDWLDKLINETLPVPFWIRGTIHKKRGDRLRKSPPEYWAHRMHLNGAALYNVHDRDFYRDFIGMVAAMPDEGPFDFALENFTKDEANWEYMMDRLDKFQYSDFIQNVINDNITREQVLERFPQTYLVHGLGRKPGVCGSCVAKEAKEREERERQKAANAARASNSSKTASGPSSTQQQSSSQSSQKPSGGQQAGSGSPPSGPPGSQTPPKPPGQQPAQGSGQQSSSQAGQQQKSPGQQTPGQQNAGQQNSGQQQKPQSAGQSSSPPQSSAQSGQQSANKPSSQSSPGQSSQQQKSGQPSSPPSGQQQQGSQPQTQQSAPAGAAPY